MPTIIVPRTESLKAVREFAFSRVDLKSTHVIYIVTIPPFCKQRGWISVGYYLSGENLSAHGRRITAAEDSNSQVFVEIKDEDVFRNRPVLSRECFFTVSTAV